MSGGDWAQKKGREFHGRFAKKGDNILIVYFLFYFFPGIRFSDFFFFLG